jgi:hypothetical protein
VLIHAVPKKVSSKATLDGNMVRQVQRSWLNEAAYSNFQHWNNQKKQNWT